MELTSQIKMARFQSFWIQMRKTKLLDESRKSGQTSWTKMAFYSFIYYLSMRTDLNVDIKHTPPKAAKLCIISKNNLGKVKANVVTSIAHAETIISQRYGRGSCIHVQFRGVHREPRTICQNITVRVIIIQEVTRIAKSPSIIS
ncbi:hypothetical protein Hanom_Chr11g00983481 [Helianthus anomalus]